MSLYLLKNQRIIINTDLDGLISGLLLTNFCNCEVVGFTNSSDAIWINKNKSKSVFDAVYVDMFVLDKNVITLDQHIVSLNENHHKLLIENKNKINPNFDNPRYHLPNDSYFSKYPFGTVHYLIALFNKEGILLPHFNIDAIIEAKFNFKDFLLRADDAMNTTVVKYPVNAENWWSWLINFSNDSQFILQLVDYLKTLNEQDVLNKKNFTTTYLKTNFKCDTPDGGFKNILDVSGNLKQNILNYFSFIAQSCNLKNFEIENTTFTKISGVNERIQLSDLQKKELIENGTINNEIVFSYACVKTNSKTENFSYTILTE